LLPVKGSKLSWFHLVVIVGVGLKAGRAQTSIVPASLAVKRALDTANFDGPIGGSTTQPTEARGQVMTYGEAIQFIFGRPMDPNESIAKLKDYPILLVVLQGQFVEHVPAAADGSIPAKDVIHSQMAVILDGNTAEVLEQILVSPAKALAVSTLPVLPVHSDAIPPVPTKGPISTEAPYPTQSP
jgi:hypothetical protein